MASIKEEFFKALHMKGQGPVGVIIENNNKQIDICITECIRKLKKGETAFCVHVDTINGFPISSYINSRLEREVGHYIKEVIGLENSTEWTGNSNGLHVKIYPCIGETEPNTVDLKYVYRDDSNIEKVDIIQEVYCEKKIVLDNNADIADDFVKVVDDESKSETETKPDMIINSHRVSKGLFIDDFGRLAVL